MQEIVVDNFAGGGGADERIKLGSLFDGSGTAPLAAAMCGIEPVWASEIEPYPIKVTKTRFPHMLHLGSIMDIHGGNIKPVDIICGGSPCQDLSIAGKQAGLRDGERSHLFFEMTRIIKQMREATHGQYPRYVIWENVPGAFSSNKGRDFLAVLRAFAEIADPDIHVPEPEGKSDRLAWKYAGEVVGGGGGAFLGGQWMLNTGEFPSAVAESTLSQILQENAPEKYYLSARACQGILNRAERRGKKLPLMLVEALMEVVALNA